MGYIRSYVDKMLKKHPQGNEFRLIRKLARRAGNLYPPEKTELEQVSLGILNIVTFASDTFYTKRHARGWRSSGFELDPSLFMPDEEKRKKRFEELRIKLSGLIQLLDTNEDSQWIARYMIDEGASCCDVAQQMFKDYLKGCESESL